MSLPPKLTQQDLDRQRAIWLTCGKVRFDTEVKAQYRALEIGLTYYQCPHCKGWHLTKGRFVGDALKRLIRQGRDSSTRYST